CARFGLEFQGHEECLKRLAAPCQGWPRHLHFALQALGRKAFAADGSLLCIDWTGVEEEAAASRIRYYQAQRSPAIKESASLVAAVMHELTPGARRVDVINSIIAHEGTHPGRQWSFPGNMDAELMADHLIHQGALHEMPDGTPTAPIPSFRTYLIEAGHLDSAPLPAPTG
ncbi:MAG: hypothetical protein OXC91_02380, partial [Rhodobacteraceae bacterium]|nr:hypothetical protein [Paracoccaceae bacterium]